MSPAELIRNKYLPIKDLMNERLRRLWAAEEAQAIGWGGISAVATATGLSRTTITFAISELKSIRHGNKISSIRVRKQGGGRPTLLSGDRFLTSDLKKLVDVGTRGDPESLLKWTCKSAAKLVEELNLKGHVVSERTVNRLLHEMNFSLQSNRKTIEGHQHPDRDSQFEHINNRAQRFVKNGEPVISVDTKKKELIGRFKNNGREWHPRGIPEKVRVHDFIEKDLGKGIPYGIYDLTANEGWVSVGIDHDTAEFATETIRRWWHKMGTPEYPNAQELLVTADGGGSNGSRSRLWKVALQKLANDIGLKISVCHFPPGTSKWNKIEHRMFCHITENWRGRPLISREVMVNLIGNTTTKTGLKIKAKIDNKTYLTGKKVSDEELKTIRIKKDKFHGEWNYTISPSV
jgi:transposase